MTSTLTNWAGNFAYSTSQIYVPQTQSELQAWVAGCQQLRGLGTRHAFNTIADSPHHLVTLTQLNQVLSLDSVQHKVTVEGGMTYSQLGSYLFQAGYALHNLASLTDLSIVGACSTATHGSGDANGNLATAVASLEIVTATGDMVTFTREDAEFMGIVVGLGAVGIVANITLDIMPTFDMQQAVFLNLPLAQVIDQFDRIMSSAYSVSLFTTWQSDTVDQVFVKALAGASQLDLTSLGASQATQAQHPIPSASPEHCTTQLGAVGAWYERLPHFRAGFTPSFGQELQSEYFVPRESAIAALKALNSIRDQIAPHLLISEVRTIAADQLWMSPCYQQDSVAFHFTWKPDQAAIQQLLPVIEAALAPFKARPHWGKLFTMPPVTLQALYPKLPEFRQLLMQYDPQGKFRNSFIQTYLFGE